MTQRCRAALVGILAAFLGGLTLPAPAEAQYFGRNQVKYESFNFEVLQTEHFLPEPVRADLARRGHDIQMLEVPIGGCPAIWIDRDRGVLIGGSEPRTDGKALWY